MLGATNGTPRLAGRGDTHAANGPSSDGGAGRIEIQGVSHCFRRQRSPEPLVSLSNVTITAEPGSFTSIVGPSGCGKSTLIKLIAGLLKPTDGVVRVDGREVKGPDSARGMVFQEDAVFPWLTVEDNVAYGLRRRGVGRSGARAEARRWIASVGLEGFERSYPRELSGGMRKRVDLARSYAAGPRVMLMDEPFGALDALTRRRMQSDLLRVWEETKTTVVFVTHDLDEAVFLSDVVVVLSPRPGRLSSTHVVDLARPRGEQTREDETAIELSRRLWREVESLDSTNPLGG